VSALSDVWDIRDRTGADFRRPPTTLYLLDTSEPPMTFPGRRGAKDTIQNVTTDDDSKRSGGGLRPRTPTRQPLWRPVRRIFGENGWARYTKERAQSCA
jgi:hypothetical protein